MADLPIDSLDIDLAVQQFPRVRDAFEELCLDALEAVRAVLDEGSNEDRIAVAKMLSASIQKMISSTGGTANTADTEQLSAASEARAIMESMWKDLG